MRRKSFTGGCHDGFEQAQHDARHDHVKIVDFVSFLLQHPSLESQAASIQFEGMMQKGIIPHL